MNRLRATKTEFLGRLVHSILRQTDKLLDIADRSLYVHRWNMKTERRELDCHHILRIRNILPELLNIQRTTKHPEQMAMRSRGQGLGCIESTIHI
jgi:hypothetical protein